MYSCGLHLRCLFNVGVHSFAFVNVYACSTPIPILLWCDHFQTCSVVEWFGPWLRPQVPSPLFSSLSSPLTHFQSTSFCLFFSSYPLSPLFLPRSLITESFSSSLPTSFNPSSVIPEVFPLLSWQIPVIPDSPQGMCRVLQTFLHHARLSNPQSGETHDAGKCLGNRES